MEEPFGWKEYLDLAGKSIGLAVALGFVLSIAYDFGYLAALGLRFEDLPSTISDHVRTALLWLPFAIMMIMIPITLLLKPLTSQAPHPERVDRRRRLLWLFVYPLLALCAVGLMFYAVVLVEEQALVAILIFLSMAVAILAATIRTPKKYLHDQRVFALARLVGMVAIAFLLFAAFGSYSASYRNADTKPRVRLILKDDSQPIEARAVRYFERGALLSNWPEKESEFVPWDRIREVKRINAK